MCVKYIIVLLALWVGGLPSLLHAGPAAGTIISNQAVATYQDAVTGLFATLSSNIVRVTVQPLEALALVSNQTQLRPAGTSVTLAHRLTNTGNTPATYALTFSNLGGDNFDLTGLALVQDVNGNGVQDSGEPAIANGGTVNLSVGQAMDLVLTGLVPGNAPVSGSATITLNATSQVQGASATNTDTVTVVVGPVLIASQSAAPLSAAANQLITLTIAGNNTGNGVANPIPVLIDGNAQSAVVVREPIPANTTFDSLLVAGSSAVRYHRASDPLHTYLSAAPPLGQIDAVAFTYPSIPAGQAFTLSLQVKTNANAGGTATQMGVMYYHDGVSSTSANTNTVVLSFSGVAPTLSYYTNGAYTTVAGIGVVGGALYLQANAAACNLNPSLVETHPIVVTSTLTGDTESMTATETAPNSGMFRILPDLPTRDGVANPVVNGNGILEVRKSDTAIAQISGCGPNPAQTSLLIDPDGVVFDSKTNAPIGGATVQLLNVLTNSPATVFQADGVTPAPSMVITAADGRFAFPLVSTGTYRLVVTPPNGYSFPSTVPVGQLPAGRAIDLSGSYGGTFQITTANGPVALDVPLDPGATAGLFVEKTAGSTTVEVVDFVDYTVKITNNTTFALPSVLATDRLPAGFAYVPGTARVNGGPIADPVGGRGPTLAFAVGNLGSGAGSNLATLTYRVRTGPGSLQGDGVNRVQASSGSIVSNVATAKVTVQGGIFSDKGFILGKIFLDCNRDRIQGTEELGIPGVRLYLEDGTSAVSDSEGKYTFYGISPRTHVLKIDRTTLPEGAELIALANRNAGDAGSRFVDLKKGEMHPADFAVGNCDDDMMKTVKARRAKGEVTVADMERTAMVRPGAPGQANGQTAGQLSGQPMLGSTPSSTADTGREAALPRFDPTLPEKTVNTLNTPLYRDRTVNGNNSNLPPTPVAASPTVDFDKVLATLDATLGFIDLKDHDTLLIAQTNVRVKGLAGSLFTLFVNDQEIPASRVGTKSVIADKQLEAWEYIGVNLKPGENILEVTQTDNFGNPRRQTVTVIAPDQLGKLKVTLPAQGVPADGHTPALIKVQLEDAHGVPVTVRTPVTLEATYGRWQVADLNKKESGVQVFMEGGTAEFLLQAPQEPGDSIVTISSGVIRAEERISFVPDLRPLMAVGVLEGTLDLRKLNANNLLPTRNQDGFEEELRNTVERGTAQGGGRAAMFLKGKIPGDALLTMGFDSDKDTKERLFRDIQPGEFYPVYGDSSVKGFDAQSTGRLYVRIDKNKSYLLYGDYITLSGNDARSLGQYSRSLTGLKGHYESKVVSVNAFASHESSRQVIEELPALGISGPYTVSKTNAVENSEKIEILTRDRNQPAVILQSAPQTRFSDYAFEPLTGRVLFKAPIPSRDANLNPLSIRVTYEVKDDGDKFWVAGVDGQVKLTDRLEVGGSYIRDENPQDQYQLKSGNVTVKLTDKTFLIGEVAQSAKQSVGTGNAARVELRHNGEDLQARVYAAQTDTDFENQLAMIGKGRREAAAKATYRIDQQTRLLGEAIHTEDAVTHGKRDGLQVTLQRSFDNNVKLEGGFRHAHETGAPSQPSLTSPGAPPLTITTARAKISAPVPYLPQANVSGDYEQDVTSSRRIAGVGADYQLSTQGRLYMRHEFLNSISGHYALNGVQQQNATVFGVDTSYMRDGKIFSEYRARDALYGREAQAAIGLRNKWNLAPGLTANTTIERVQNLHAPANNGVGTVVGTSVTGAIEYTADPIWKGTARIERRFSQGNDAFLNTLGVGYKLSRDWTALGKNTLSFTETVGGEKIREHLRTGLAFRQTDANRWNALGHYEYKYEHDPGQTGVAMTRQVHVLATDWSYHPSKPWTFMSGYAFKWVMEDSLGLISMYHAQLLTARLTYDITERWDAGIAASNLFSGPFTSNQYSLGLEVGRIVMANVWVSVGYNFFGFKDKDLSPENYDNYGIYMRLRMKFDEGLLSMLR